MSAHPVSQLSVATDSTVIPDLPKLVVTHTRQSAGPAIAGATTTTRLVALTPKVDLLDLEPDWSATIDAATD